MTFLHNLHNFRATIVWTGLRAELVEAQTLDVQLSYSDSSTSNKSDSSAPHKQKLLRKVVGYSEVATEQCYEGQNLLSFYLSL
jgi:hypothetical protein